MIGRRPIIAVLVVLTGVAAAIAARPELRAYASGAALFVLVAAVMQPTLHLIAMDADGRLDHIRLSGQRPRDAFFRLAGRAGAPWLVLAFGLRAIAGLEREDVVSDLLTAVAIVSASCVWSMLLLAVPQQGVRIDTRLFGAGLALAAVVAAIAYTLVAPPSPTGSRELPPAGVVAVSLLTAIVVIMMMLRQAVRMVERQRSTKPSWLKSMSWLESRTWPTLDQVLTLGGRRAIRVGALAAGGIAVAAIGTVLLDWQAAQRGGRGNFDFAVVTGFVTAPAAIWTLAASSRSRSNMESGRFDLLRLVPAPPARTFLWHLVGAWSEPLIVMITMFVTLRLRWQQWPPGTAAIVLTLLALIPLSVVEGWHRRWPLTYVGAVLGSLVWLAISFPTTYPLRMLAVVWIPWVIAFRTFRRPDAKAITPLMAITGAAAIAGALLWPV